MIELCSCCEFDSGSDIPEFSELGALAKAFERLMEERAWTAELERWCMMVTAQVLLFMWHELPSLMSEPEISIPTPGSKSSAIGICGDHSVRGAVDCKTGTMVKFTRWSMESLSARKTSLFD
jgi:hypothetical protein